MNEVAKTFYTLHLT
uniref:Uncharacterized protein n=1 Tax=Anguilla anguilla TaxID=7936 RepID=A0A0E9VGP7_ANGAN